MNVTGTGNKFASSETEDTGTGTGGEPGGEIGEETGEDSGDEKTEGITATDVSNSPSTYYGRTVTNYTSQNGQSDWEIFYSDGTHIFLITSDYVVTNNKIDTTKTKMTTDGTYRAYWNSVPTMQEVSSEILSLYKATGYTLNSSYKNSKCVSTLLNTENWTSFKDIENKAESAIGGPTVEMWMESWNNLYPSDKLYCNKTGYYGYHVGTIDSPTTDSIDLSAKAGYSNKLYYPRSTRLSDGDDEAIYYWLASPSNDVEDDLLFVNFTGRIDNWYYNRHNGTLRPVVCLKSGITVNIIEE